MIFLAGSTHIGAVHTFRNICVETPDYLQVGQAFGVDPTIFILPVEVRACDMPFLFAGDARSYTEDWT